MNISNAFRRAFEFFRSDTVPYASQSFQPPVDVVVASGLHHFMLVLPMMRRAAVETCAPIEPNRIGAMLATMNFGGSGPKNGCTIVALSADEVVGFAVLLPKPGNQLELAWLHVDKEFGDDVVEKLWAKAKQTQIEWQAPALKIGPFVRQPEQVKYDLSTDFRSQGFNGANLYAVQ